MRSAIPPSLKTRARIDLSPVEPAMLSFRHALGIDFNLSLSIFARGEPLDPTPWYPQFVLVPRSTGGVQPYDMTVTDPANGVTEVHVPGSSLVDRNGYNVEVYARQDAKPTGMMARGQMVTDGLAYGSPGPLSMINVPVIEGPPGPQGPAGVGIQGDPGEPGERGSKWTSGPGEPSSPPPLDTLTGDMYLDTVTGIVWTWTGVDWVATAP